MPNKLTNALFHIVPAGMVRRIGTLAYGYYMLFRVLVTAAAVLLTAFRLSADQIFQRLDWTFLGRCRSL
jgi:hypothetical protein